MALSKAEEEILHMLSEQYMTPKQISYRRKTSRQAVHKIIKKLKEKGLVRKNFLKVDKNQWYRQPFKKISENNSKNSKARLHDLRLHGLEFNIRLVWRGVGYGEKVGSILFVDGNRVRCFRNSIECYSERSFFGGDVEQVTRHALDYFERVFYKIEEVLNVVLVKAGALNIRLVKAEYAEVGNELARKCEVDGEKVKVFARDDGKLWFMIDNSLNLFEAETVHPQTSKEDMGRVIRPFFNDLRDNFPNEVPTVSQIMSSLDAISEAVKAVSEVGKETAEGLNASVKVLGLILGVGEKKDGGVDRGNVDGEDKPFYVG